MAADDETELTDMAKDETGGLLARLAKAAALSGTRSPLRAHMRRDFAALSLIIRPGSDWEGLAEEWVREGLMPSPDARWWDASLQRDPAAMKGRARAADTARRTWQRECQHQAGGVVADASAAPAVLGRPAVILEVPASPPVREQTVGGSVDPAAERRLARAAATADKRSTR